MFGEKTIQELGSYVYALLDEENKPFYVGKGYGNRVFNHVDMSIKEDISTLKYDKIREIGHGNVKYVIIRHGLTEEESFIVESSCIDLLFFLGYPLTNIQSGHKSLTKGLMSANEINRIYNAEPLDSMAEDCVIININRSYDNIRRNNHSLPSDSEIYDATKGIWAMDIKRAEQKKYVLSVYKGLVVEVFEVKKWLQEKRHYSSSSMKHGNSKRLGCSFEGEVATEDIRGLYVNKSIKHKIRRGNANPIRYEL